MDENINTIAEKIKYYRKLRRFNQEQLALYSGINVSTIKKYECGIRNPKPDQLEKIAAALGISMNSFFSYDIRNVGDVLSYIIKLHRAAGMSITGNKDENGEYIPQSISLSFSQGDINEYLVRYLTYLDEHPDDNPELDYYIIDNDAYKITIEGHEL